MLKSYVESDDKNHITDVWQSEISNVSLKANYDRQTEEKVSYRGTSFRSAQKAVKFQYDDVRRSFEIPIITDNFLSERPCVMRIYYFTTFE